MTNFTEITKKADIRTSDEYNIIITVTCTDQFYFFYYELNKYCIDLKLSKTIDLKKYLNPVDNTSFSCEIYGNFCHLYDSKLLYNYFRGLVDDINKKRKWYQK